jgi:hypothetical protein
VKFSLEVLVEEGWGPYFEVEVGSEVLLDYFFPESECGLIGDDDVARVEGSWRFPRGKEGEEFVL